MEPLLKYRGGKRKEIDLFIKFIPKKFDNYIEPFFGGGALYFYLEPEKAIINDINEPLINFYREVANDYDSLMSQLYELKRTYTHQNYILLIKMKNYIIELEKCLMTLLKVSIQEGRHIILLIKLRILE